MVYKFKDVDDVTLYLASTGYGPENVVGVIFVEENGDGGSTVYVTRKQARKLGRKLFELAAKGE